MDYDLGVTSSAAMIMKELAILSYFYQHHHQKTPALQTHIMAVNSMKCLD